MRYFRPGCCAVLTIGLAVAVSGCASLPVEVADGRLWSVGVTDPRFHGEDMCGDDPAIESTALSMDMPSSGYGIRFKPGSTEDDVMRVATCLQSALVSGGIRVVGPISD